MEDIILNKEKIISDMQDMIRCRTVSYRDENLVEKGEFERFENLLKERFPLIKKNSVFRKISKTGLMFYIKGLSEKKSARVLMAHYDVVPAKESDWEKPPFDAIIENNILWGRGTLDTKGTLCSIFESIEFLLEKNWKPKEDLYLCFSGEEEIDGDSCSEIVKWFEENSINVDFVLDEGGAIVEKAFPGVKERTAMIGIAEKGFVNFECSYEGKDGHASTPPKHTSAGVIAKAITRVENHPFKFQYTKAAKEMMKTLSKHSTPFYKFFLGNLWLFMPLFNLVTKLSGGEMYAITHTTQAVTRLQGSDAYNVLPKKSSFGINLRLIGKDTVEKAYKHIRKAIKNPDIKIEIVTGMNPSICSDVKCEQWEILKSAINKTWKNVVVSPYLMMACSDSRHYCKITDKVYRFSGMFLSKEDRAMIHGKNERINLDILFETVKFYINLLKEL